MKVTRNLFSFECADKSTIPKLIEALQFKGMIVFDSNSVTPADIGKVFSKNKSVACINLPQDLSQPYPVISIQVSPNQSSDRPTINPRGDIVEQFQQLVETLGLDVGDHISNSSGLNGTPSVSDCGYCKYLIHREFDEPATVYKNEHFFVFTTVGQMIPGYLLIIPLEHVMSIAELDSATRMEFLDVLEDICYILTLTYHSSNFLVWENGTGNLGRGKAKDSVVHAHVHVAISSLTDKSICKTSGFQLEDTSMEDLSRYGEHSYLLLRAEDNQHWKINDDPKLYIPRQYVRQLLAEEYGIPGEQWNWRRYPFVEQRFQTTSDIATALLRNYAKLPERIQKNTECLLSRI